MAKDSLLLIAKLTESRYLSSIRPGFALPFQKGYVTEIEQIIKYNTKP